MTRPQDEVDAVRDLHAFGLNDCQISRELNIPRGTLRGWLYPRHPERRILAEARRAARACQRCNGTESSLSVDYVYLLGLYLGDGCISGNRKGVWKLRIFQDQRYRGLISECVLAMSAVTRSRVSVVPSIGCVEIGAYWKHWVHLFPQAGPGPKWLRRIALEPWQKTLTNAYPAQLIRGLVHSDGCRFLNRIKHMKDGTLVGYYAYPRYSFSNNSDDIRLLFTEACDQLNVHWTQTRKYTVSVSRNEDVKFLDRFIGPKC